MKKSYILIALAMVAALSMVGCKNNKKNQNQEPTQEEIQAQKQALADSVLAKIDAYFDQYVDAKSKSFQILDFKLTESEKMIKPDYLLDPSEAAKLVTKSQKVNALAIYLVEKCVRVIYDMPLDETNEVLARLAADVNYPLDYDMQNIKDIPASERIRKEYIRCKENGELACFWNFQFAILREISYLMVMNPEFFFNRITEDEWKAFDERWSLLTSTLERLAEYDTEISEIWETIYDKSADDNKVKYGTLYAGRKSYAKDKDLIIARRNALLQ